MVLFLDFCHMAHFPVFSVFWIGIPGKYEVIGTDRTVPSVFIPSQIKD